MVKAVIDANVWVSALIASGNSRLIVEAFKQDILEVFYPSASFLRECNLIGMSREQVEKLLGSGQQGTVPTDSGITKTRLLFNDRNYSSLPAGYTIIIRVNKEKLSRAIAEGWKAKKHPKIVFCWTLTR